MNIVQEGLHQNTYQIFKVPPVVIDEVENATKNIANDFEQAIGYQGRLAGEIQHEYALDVDVVPLLSDFTKRALTDYERNVNLIDQIFKVPILLLMDSFWVNFQQKGEYNPIHSHSGIYSYVYWHKVPYTYEEEVQYSKAQTEYCHNGLFNFHNTNPYGTVGCESLKVDKTAEGYMCIFPATLSHSVHPFFSSDDYRITIAGNIMASTQQGYPILDEDGILNIIQYKKRAEQVANDFKMNGFI